MAITIGRKLESDYANPLGMLSDCHRRIEKFLNLLLAVTKQAQGKELNDEYHTAFATALRYFRGRSFGIETKGYRDPVTDADKAVERHVHDCVLPFLMTVLSEKKEQARRASPVGIG